MSQPLPKEDLAPSRRAILIVLASAFLIGPSAAPMEIIAGVSVILGWWLVPRFWRSALIGAVAGVLAGLLILGPGFRVAMRVVALFDPIRVPEFSLDGTLFIVLGIGGMFGGLVGVFANLARQGLGLTSVFTAAVYPAFAAFGLLLLAEETRNELLELGRGVWVNAPMFATVSYAYGLTCALVIMHLETRSARKRRATMSIEVPT